MKDLISVITTFYNSEKYILQCIESVNNQVYDDTFDIEYIIINDWSEDNTENIIKDYFNKNQHINYQIIKTPKNLGCGGSRKFGIDHAHGDYFMFLDSDDYYLHNDFILRAHNLIIKYDADIIEFGYQRYNNETHRMVYKSVNSLIKVDNDIVTKFNYLSNLHIINYMVWTKIIKRSIIETKKYDISRTYEDIKTTPYWVYNANKIIINPSIEINYRNRDESIINETIYIKFLDIVKAVSSLFEDFKFNKNVLKIFYTSIFNEIKYILINLNSDYKEFNKMVKLNSYMLSYIYPNTYKDITYDVENDNNK